MGEDDIFIARKVDVITACPAVDAILQRQQLFFTLLNSNDINAVQRPAVFFCDDHVLGYVNKTACQIPRVCSL